MGMGRRLGLAHYGLNWRKLFPLSFPFFFLSQGSRSTRVTAFARVEPGILSFFSCCSVFALQNVHTASLRLVSLGRCSCRSAALVETLLKSSSNLNSTGP